jgi:PEP-CTERM motif
LAVPSDRGDATDTLAVFEIDGAPATPMPEPGSLALFGVALLALGGMHRRKSKVV